MEKDSPLSTNRLFHYTPKQDYLIDILRNGFQSRFSLEKLNILKGEERMAELSEVLRIDPPCNHLTDNLIDEFAIAMTCFCDIPLNLVLDHVKLYGQYAVGLKKEWGEKSGICPVFYIPDHGETRTLFESLIKGYYNNYEKLKQLKDASEEPVLIGSVLNFCSNVIDLSFYIKPYMGDYERKEETLVNYKFYDEKEWRYIPNNLLFRTYMSKDEFQVYENGSSDVELARLPFEPSDITDVFVPEGEVDVVRELISSIPRMKEFDLGLVKSRSGTSSR